ncbi:hypothetical protein [Rummeliibacillus pycnus]|uniref:hypothetical protein n=1 Tax=Rummeliibacillus pycnus TaxID=101070 RepID=UPI0037CB88BD
MIVKLKRINSIIGKLANEIFVTWPKKIWGNKILKPIIIILGGLFLFLFFAILFPDLTKLLGNLYSIILMFYFLQWYFNISSKIINKKREKAFENEAAKNDNSKLYHWISKSELFEESFYEWLSKESCNSLTKNLKLLKSEIILSVGDNIFDYYIIKDYLVYYSKNNFLYKIWRLIVPVFTGVLGSLLLKILTVDKLLNYILQKQNQTQMNLPDKSIMILDISSTVTFGICIIIFIRSELTKNKRIIDLLINIVNIIIKEKEGKLKISE